MVREYSYNEKEDRLTVLVTYPGENQPCIIIRCNSTASHIDIQKKEWVSFLFVRTEIDKLREFLDNVHWKSSLRCEVLRARSGNPLLF